MGVLTVLPYSGDAQQHRWNPDDPVSTARVRTIFERLLASDYLAYEVIDHRQGDFASAFNPGALYIVMQPLLIKTEQSTRESASEGVR